MIDYSLYLVTDSGLCRGDFFETIKSAIRGGVTIVQLREKLLETGEFFQKALALKKFLDERKIPLIINDRIDIALAVGAAGVHIGQRDMPPDIARKMLGEGAIVGVSVGSVDEAIAAERGGVADYLGISPVWTTPTKVDTSEPVGLEGIRKIRKKAALPLIGIGGIKANNVESVIEAGCDGVAVVSAIMTAENPEIAARELIIKIKSARSK